VLSDNRNVCRGKLFLSALYMHLLSSRFLILCLCRIKRFSSVMELEGLLLLPHKPDSKGYFELSLYLYVLLYLLCVYHFVTLNNPM
jgi:hypothetical protein